MPLSSGAMRGALLLMVCVALATPRGAWAQEEGAPDEDQALLVERVPPNLSTDLFDRSGRSAFHLTGRATFDDGVSAFSKSSVWAFEAQGALRIFRGLAATFALPFGLTAPSPGSNTFFFGNFRLGVAGGNAIVVVPSTDRRAAGFLEFGGAFDVYVPTAPDFGDLDCPGLDFCAPVSQVRGLRSYEPFLYAERLMSFRPRGQVGFLLDPFEAQLELGLVPGFTTRAEVDFFMFLSWAVRARVFPIAALEPYLEVGSNLQVAGPKVQALGGSIDASTSVQLTLGLRLHIASVDPALFVTLDLADGFVIFGVDLAGALREVANTRGERDLLDF